jgi:MSHA pilin protein MshD
MCARRLRGFTLIELVILIVVIGVALAGVLLVFQTVVRGSADPQQRKQALAIAEALLDEVLLSSYDPQPGSGSRANFDNVDDYGTPPFDTAPGGMTDINGAPIPGLGAYNARVTVDTPGLAGVAEAKRVTVTVTVTGQPDMTITLDGYRLRYDAP